jgi:hypothetical protein
MDSMEIITMTIESARGEIKKHKPGMRANKKHKPGGFSPQASSSSHGCCRQGFTFERTSRIKSAQERSLAH